jgi:anthranilate synthase/aminodeoxychorismate synthase-like glutamine amidotransferase
VILLIDNYDSFTYNLVQRLGEIDPALDVRVVRNDQITPDEALALKPSHVIISPGPCTPKEAGVSPDIIRAFAGRLPVLGVCLGHQCMGDMNGMTVTRHSVAMHGKVSPIRHDNQGVFRGLSNPFAATRYHSLVVLEDTIPALGADGSGWLVSAWCNEPLEKEARERASEDGPTRRVVMGLRRAWSAAEVRALGGHAAPLEGVQFHPESFLTLEGPRLLRNFVESR